MVSEHGQPAIGRAVESSLLVIEIAKTVGRVVSLRCQKICREHPLQGGQLRRPIRLVEELLGLVVIKQPIRRETIRRQLAEHGASLAGHGNDVAILAVNEPPLLILRDRIERLQCPLPGPAAAEPLEVVKGLFHLARRGRHLQRAVGAIITDLIGVVGLLLPESERGKEQKRQRCDENKFHITHCVW